MFSIDEYSLLLSMVFALKSQLSKVPSFIEHRTDDGTFATVAALNKIDNRINTTYFCHTYAVA